MPHHHTHEHSEITTQGHTLPRMARFYDLITFILSLGRERSFRERALKLAAIMPGEAVLDVGCGTGTLALLAKKYAGTEGKVVGIDPTAKMIDVARRKASRRGADVQFNLGVIEKLAHANEEFDVVLSTLMMHHLPAELKQEGLVEVRRVLKPQGRLVIVDWDAGAHSMESAIHGGGEQASGSSLQERVLQAGFEGVESGSMQMSSIIYVKANKPG